MLRLTAPFVSHGLAVQMLICFNKSSQGACVVSAVRTLPFLSISELPASGCYREAEG